MVMRADGSGSIVPLAIYPPGFDFSNFFIFDPATSADWFSGAGYIRPMPLASSLDGPTGNGPTGDGPGDGPGDGGGSVTSGFFRVFHIPNWAFNVTNYTYDSSWFFPIDFKDYRERVERVELLINGEPTAYAEYMPYASGGQTNWGLGIDFDRLANGTYQIQLVTTLALNDETGRANFFL